MAISIGSNIAAFKAIRRLDETSSILARTFERLSSGARINRASDDPAGLAISSSLNSQRRVLTRASLNIGDGVSTLQIADSAVEAASRIVERMTELAQQSSNGTFSRFQRINLDKEYQQLDKELTRLSRTTKFNGIDLLRGSAPTSTNQRVVADLGTNTFLSQKGVSQDGRFVATLGISSLTINDTTTGTARTITPPLGTVQDVTVLANGDAVIQQFDNSENGSLLYYYDWQTNTTKQLTNSGNGILNGLNYSVSADGSKLVFGSALNYTEGGTLADGTTNSGVFGYYTLDLASGVFNRISVLDGAFVDALNLSADGRYLGISSTENIGGANPGGLSQAFIVDLNSARTSATKLTNNIDVASSSLIIDGVSTDGRVVFRTDANLTGDNAGNNTQFFESNISNQGVRQLTNFSSAVQLIGTSFTNTAVTSLFIRALDSDLSGEGNASGRQLYELDIANGGITRRSRIATNILTNAAISADGNVAYRVTGSSLIAYDTTRGSSNIDLEVGYGASGNIVARLSALSTSIRGLGSFTLTSQLSSRAALDRLSANTALLASLRGDIGASLSRLAIAGNVVNSRNVELGAAEGRIRDADIASETARLVSTQVLQRVTASLLSQINRAPELALTLLRQ